MRHKRPAFAWFRLPGDKPGTWRRLRLTRAPQVRRYLDRTYGAGRWALR